MLISFLLPFSFSFISFFLFIENYVADFCFIRVLIRFCSFFQYNSRSKAFSVLRVFRNGKCSGRIKDDDGKFGVCALNRCSICRKIVKGSQLLQLPIILIFYIENGKLGNIWRKIVPQKVMCSDIVRKMRTLSSKKACKRNKKWLRKRTTECWPKRENEIDREREREE